MIPFLESIAGVPVSVDVHTCAPVMSPVARSLCCTGC
jgi:hypothetical protein